MIKILKVYLETYKLASIDQSIFNYIFLSYCNIWSFFNDVKFSTALNDKRMIILYAVPISLWHMLGEENRYF